MGMYVIRKDNMIVARIEADDFEIIGNDTGDAPMIVFRRGNQEVEYDTDFDSDRGIPYWNWRPIKRKKDKKPPKDKKDKKVPKDKKEKD